MLNSKGSRKAFIVRVKQNKVGFLVYNDGLPAAFAVEHKYTANLHLGRGLVEVFPFQSTSLLTAVRYSQTAWCPTTCALITSMALNGAFEHECC